MQGSKKLTAPWNIDGDDEELFGDESVIEAGRRVAPFTYVHDWVTLSGVDPEAKCAYNIFRMHVFDKSGTQTCGPRLDDIAQMMGYARGDRIIKFVKQLVELGALEVAAWGLPRRNKYTVHEAPPPGYTGPLTIKDWKLAHHAERVSRREALKKANGAKKQRMRDRSAGTEPS